MLIPTIAPYRRRRGRHTRARYAPPQGPVLLEATYDPEGLIVRIRFDRAIDMSGMDGSMFVINDPTVNHAAYVGTGGAELSAPDTLRIWLGDDGAATGTQQTLTVMSGNGIRAADDLTDWPGTPPTPLPYPPA